MFRLPCSPRIRKVQSKSAKSKAIVNVDHGPGESDSWSTCDSSKEVLRDSTLHDALEELQSSLHLESRAGGLRRKRPEKSRPPPLKLRSGSSFCPSRAKQTSTPKSSVSDADIVPEELSVIRIPLGRRQTEKFVRSRSPCYTPTQLAKMSFSSDEEDEDDCIILDETGNDVKTDQIPQDHDAPVTLCTFGRSQVNSSDYKTLGEGEFLNDEIINFYLEWLWTEKLLGKKQDQVHIFSSHFYSRLVSKPKNMGKKVQDFETDNCKSQQEKSYLRVQRWTKSVDIFAKKLIFVPICQRDHWFLVVICNADMIDKPREQQILAGEPTIIVLDSMGGTQSGAVNSLRKYLQFEYLEKKKKVAKLGSAEMKALRPSVPQQPNSSDCGCYVLTYAEKLIEDWTVLKWRATPDLTNWFPDEEATNKRIEISELVTRLCEEQNPARAEFDIPDISLPKRKRVAKKRVFEKEGEGDDSRTKEEEKKAKEDVTEETVGMDEKERKKLRWKGKKDKEEEEKKAKEDVTEETEGMDEKERKKLRWKGKKDKEEEEPEEKESRKVKKGKKKKKKDKRKEEDDSSMDKTPVMISDEEVEDGEITDETNDSKEGRRDRKNDEKRKRGRCVNRFLEQGGLNLKPRSTPPRRDRFNDSMSSLEEPDTFRSPDSPDHRDRRSRRRREQLKVTIENKGSPRRTFMSSDDDPFRDNVSASFGYKTVNRRKVESEHHVDELRPKRRFVFTKKTISPKLRRGYKRRDESEADRSKRHVLGFPSDSDHSGSLFDD